MVFMNREDLLRECVVTGESIIKGRFTISHVILERILNAELFWEFGMGCGMKSLSLFYIPFLCLLNKI